MRLKYEQTAFRDSGRGFCLAPVRRCSQALAVELSGSTATTPWRASPTLSLCKWRWNWPAPFTRMTRFTSAMRSTTWRMAAGARVRGVGVVSMLASAQELLAAGAAECTGSVVEWIDRFLDAKTPS